MTLRRGATARIALTGLLLVAAGCAPSSAAPSDSGQAAATPALTTLPPALASAPTAPGASGPNASGPAASGPASPSAAPTLAEPASPAPPSASTAPRFGHVYLVVMENREFGDIVGASDAPYLNGLIAKFGLATDMHAVAHPSEPNYLALVSGSTQGVHDDGVYNLDAPSLFDQVEAAGRTWRVYAQGYPGSCSGVDFTDPVADGPGQPGRYARKHNPAISFTSISRNPSRCARITGLAGFDPSAADFELIVPNQVNDMHDASVATGDAFLRSFLPSILDSAAFAAGALLVVTWDEGTSNDGGGGHIATVLATPGMAPGTRFNGAYTHDSVLRTIEDGWGMPPLGGAANAKAIPVGG